MFSFLVASTNSTGAYYAYEVSDGLGQAIVILLLLASVVTWSVMIIKGMSLHKGKSLSDHFYKKFTENKKPLSSLGLASQIEKSPLSTIYSSGIEKLQEFYTINSSNVQENSGNLTEINSSKVVTEEQIIAIEAVLEAKISNEIIELESGVSFLATIVSVCPFVGLFGTVWGVMLAFVGMAKAGNADIGAMAPGIASALLTTVVGLIVAIPSVIGYNSITSSIKKMTIMMDSFSENFIARIKLEQAAKGK